MPFELSTVDDDVLSELEQLIDNIPNKNRLKKWLKIFYS